MALLSTYNSTNQVVSQGLVVKYSIEPDRLNTTVQIPSQEDPNVTETAAVDITFYRCKRYATKQYSYIGLTAAAAATCAAAKVAKYTRAYSSIVTSDTLPYISASTATLCSSDIAAVHVEGNAWRVDINVNEVDELATVDNPPADVAALFSTANARDYD